jgi:hypothetical protein
MTESADESRRKLDARGRRYAEELARSEVQSLELAASVLERWRQWWRDPEALSELSVEARLQDKFACRTSS